MDIVPVTAGGFVDLAELESLLGPDVLLVSVIAANAETGVMNPLRELSEIVRENRCPAPLGHHAIRWTNAARDGGVGHRPCFAKRPQDLWAWWCGGPRWATDWLSARLCPQIHGGGHERGLRSGSLNVAGVVGLGAAADLARQERASESRRVGRLRDRFIQALKARLPNVSEIGDVSCRLPNTANLRFHGADADAVVVNLDPVAASTGSACSSGSIEPSDVLSAMGLSRGAAFECVRFSLGRFTTQEDVDLALDRTVEAVSRVRGLAGDR